jgi:cell division protein FtsI (penicillin-binding protein 3)
MISPVLVREIKDGNESLETFKTKVINHSICDEQTLQDIRACLHDVVWDNELGTASTGKWRQQKAQSNLVKIAGKTGTAQLIENGKYTSQKHRMSFVGYFPEDNPQYTCICVISNPRNKGFYDSGLDCGGVVRRIAESTMIYASEYVIQGNQLVLQPKKK